MIGSNNSAHDICGALWENDADVTMVQRSSTHVVKSASLMEFALGSLYSEKAVARGITTEKADLTFASLPYRIMSQYRSRSTNGSPRRTGSSTNDWRRPDSGTTGVTTVPGCS